MREEASSRADGVAAAAAAIAAGVRCSSTSAAVMDSPLDLRREATCTALKLSRPSL